MCRTLLIANVLPIIKACNTRVAGRELLVCTGKARLMAGHAETGSSIFVKEVWAVEETGLV